ncbi:MAG: hypothetical protein Q4G46_10660, partial [Propionibacteriaceae bacterium]|nr:hypothetical protein [Propionibacteriaceae bacterium]
TQARHNRAKSSRDATRWLPPAESAHCAYAARQVAVKQRYELTVTTIEMDVLGEILTDCPDEPLPDGSERPNRIPAAAVAPTSAAAPGAASPSATAPGGVTRPRVLATPDEQGVYRNVAPGAYCSPLGAAGTTDTGTPMVCRLSATGDRPRWRAA